MSERWIDPRRWAEKGMATLIVLLSLLALGIVFMAFTREQSATIETVSRMEEKSVGYLRAETAAREIMKKIASGQPIGYGNLVAPADIGACVGGYAGAAFKIPADGLCRIAERTFSLRVIGCGDERCVVFSEISTGFEVEE